MMPLLRKEFRQLMPLLVMICAVMSLDYFVYPLTHRLDEISWQISSYSIAIDKEEGFFVEMLILTLMVAYSLFPREHEEKTIDFLHSLPTTRKKIFISKVSAAFLILVIGIILEYIKEWVIQLPNHQSLTGDQFRFAIALPSFFSYLIYTFSLLSFGIFISFFRRFGLIIFVMVFLAILTIGRIAPSLRFLNLYYIVSFQYHGQSILIPWRSVFFHFSLSLIFLFSAYQIWNQSGENFSHWYQKLFDSKWGKVMLTCSSGIFVLFVISFTIYLGHMYTKDEKSGPQYEKFESTRHETNQFYFTYPNSFRSQALPLIANADTIYAYLKTALNSSSENNQIVVDFTERSNHHAGIAGANKIRMDIHKKEDPNQYLRIFAHEMTHILATAESDKKIVSHHSSTLFFEEGLAEYFSFQFVPDDKRIRGIRILGAVSFKRLEIRFEELANIQTFSKIYNKNLIYPLGHLWVEALVKSCGEKTIGEFLRQLDKGSASDDLYGESFWQKRLGDANCDLESVNLTFQHLVTEILKVNQSRVETLPRINGKITEINDDDMIITACIKGELPEKNYRYHIRIRENSSDEGSSIAVYKGVYKKYRDPFEVTFTIPRSQFQKRRFQFQLGYQFQKGIMPYYEIWQTGMVP